MSIWPSSTIERKQRERHANAERFGGLEIDDEGKLARLLDGDHLASRHVNRAVACVLQRIRLVQCQSVALCLAGESKKIMQSRW
jgi:hypothetical protein